MSKITTPIGVYDLQSLNVISDSSYQNILSEVTDQIANILKKTLGPYATTTIVADDSSAYPTKDGWTVLQHLRYNDNVYNVVLNMLKKISYNLVSKVGDGTTTAIVAANSFIRRYKQYMSDNTKYGGNELAQYRQADLLKLMKKVKDDVVNELYSDGILNKINIGIGSDYEDIRKIAYISSNGDDVLADAIQNIYQKTNNPNIYVAISNGTEIEYEIQKGFKFDARLLNPNVYINTDNRTFDLNNGGWIFAFDHTVTYTEHIAIVNELLLAQRDYCNTHLGPPPCIFMFAPHYDDMFITTVSNSIENAVKNGNIPSIALVQVPYSTDSQRYALSDFMTIINGNIITHGKIQAFHMAAADGETPDNVELKDAKNWIVNVAIGVTNKIVLSEKYCLVENYDTDSIKYKNLLDEVLDNLNALRKETDKQTAVSSAEYMNVFMRYNRLCGNIGAIKVGGDSEIEKRFKKDAVDDSILACRSAYEYGYVKGMNLATIAAIRKVKKAYGLETGNLEFINNPQCKERKDVLAKLIFIKILEDTFKDVIMSLMNNKKVKDWKTTENQEINLLTTEELVDTITLTNSSYDITVEVMHNDAEEYSVINSVRTDEEILNACVSILSLLLTSNQFISSSNYVSNQEMINRDIINNSWKYDLASVVGLNTLSSLNLLN